MGATEDFKIWTDHKNLAYFRSPQKLNQQQVHITKRHFYFIFHFLTTCLSYLIWSQVTVTGHTNSQTYHMTKSPDQSYDQSCV
jgi:hypothetical protein